MPTKVVDQGIFESYFIHEAPINDKTLEIRKKFKVDESGYPEHYRWRGVARLGSSYKHEDPYLKLNPADPERDLTTKICTGLVAAGVVLATHHTFNSWGGRSFWHSAWRLPFGTAALYAIYQASNEYGRRRQINRNAIIIDYTRKHPDRFEEIHRPKCREILMPFLPCR